MNAKPIITCAVTGDGNTTKTSPHVPVTPQQIADDAIASANAGAAVVHLHVREPATGKATRKLEYYREVVERIRDSRVDVLINLTAGAGGTFFLDDAQPSKSAAGTDMATAWERMEHVSELLPDICSLDCGSFNVGDASELYLSTPGFLSEMAPKVQALGVKAELECFELGHVVNANRLVAEGWVDGTPLYQFALGLKNCAPADAASMLTMRQLIPAGAHWAAFGISRTQMPMVAQAVLLGGNVRVGLEDNLYLKRGVLATNAQLVEKAVRIIRELGAEPASAAEARAYLGITTLEQRRARIAA